MCKLDISNQQKELIDVLVNSLPSLRKTYGVSQTLLGEKVGLSRQTISSIERRITPLTWNNFLAIMMFFIANDRCIFYFPKKHGFKYADRLMETLAFNKDEYQSINKIEGCARR